MASQGIAYVVLTWNSEQVIGRCIDAIASTTVAMNTKSYLRIVDNGSSDGTMRVIESRKAQWSSGLLDIEIRRLPENRGTTVSRNLALRNLPDDVRYVCIIDSDAFITADALTVMLGALQDERVGLVGPEMRNAKNELQFSGRNLPTATIKFLKACPLPAAQRRGAQLEIPGTPVIEGRQRVPYLLSACWCTRVDVLRKVGLLDEKIFYAPEDVDWCVRVWKSGYEVVLCHGAQIVHEYQRISKKKFFSKMNLTHVQGLAHYFWKNRYLFRAPKVAN